MDQGSIAVVDSTENAIQNYMKIAKSSLRRYDVGVGVQCDIRNMDRTPVTELAFEEPFILRIDLNQREFRSGHIAIRFYGSAGELVTAINTLPSGMRDEFNIPQDGIVELEIPYSPFMPGHYKVTLKGFDMALRSTLPESKVAEFRVVDAGIGAIGRKINISKESAFSAPSIWRHS